MSPTADPKPPLRMGQRDDGKGIVGHARIQTAKNAPTSAQASTRIPDKNTYK